MKNSGEEFKNFQKLFEVLERAFTATGIAPELHRLPF
jgi:hypothetical protein